MSQLQIWRESTETECGSVIDESENVIPEVGDEAQKFIRSHVPEDKIENNIDDDISVKHVTENENRPIRKIRKPAYLLDFV